MKTMERADWPELHARVELFGPWSERWLPSLVEDRDGDELRLAVPNVPGTIVPVVARPGELISVQWVSVRGAASVDCQIELVARRALASWQCHAVGHPVVRQRRSYVRAQVRLPLQLLSVETEAEAEAPVGGWVVDLSEGGVGAFTDGDAVDVGSEARVQLELAGEPVTVLGRVLRVETAAGQHKVAIEFVDVSRRDADRIRRFVFGVQLRSLARQA